jgi:two-component system phosphate regulon response regulator OmpR
MNLPMSHIVVCDDEVDLREMVEKYLRKRNFAVTLADCGETLDQVLNDNDNVDLVLLDINMPGEDGLSILRRLRQERDIAIIMMTAAGEPVDRVIGLEMGADDYLGKPVDLRELEARIKAVLRRTEQGAVDPERPDDETARVKIRDKTLDLSSCTLMDADGTDIPITAMEFSLLKLFVKNTGRVLNRDQLMELSSDREWMPYDRSIDIRISRLRKKIEANAAKPEILRTVRGLGYVFDPDNRYTG